MTFPNWSDILGTQASARSAIGLGSFDGSFSSLSGKPTTLSGYGITDLTKNTVSPTAAISVISKQKSSSVGQIEVSSSDAAAISAGWTANQTQFTLSLTTPDSSFGGNGVKRFIGMNGNQVQYYTGVGGSSSQTSTTGTVQLYAPNPVIPNNGGTGGTVSFLTGTFLYGPSTALNDSFTPPLADCIIRPSHYTRSALWISRPDVTGLDQGYPFGIGLIFNQSWQWLSDAHTLRRYYSGGTTHFDNALTLNRQGWYTQRWGKHDAYGSAVSCIQANLDLTNQSNLTLGQEQIADGVMQFNGGTNTTPGGIAVPINAQTLATSQNDYSPGVGFNQEWTGAGDGSTVTGMVAGAPGEVREIWVLSNTVTFSHQSDSSSAANRFTCSTGADIAAAAGSVMRAVYKNSKVGWRVYKAS